MGNSRPQSPTAVVAASPGKDGGGGRTEKATSNQPPPQLHRGNRTQWALPSRPLPRHWLEFGELRFLAANLPVFLALELHWQHKEPEKGILQSGQRHARGGRLLLANLQWGLSVRVNWAVCVIQPSSSNKIRTVCLPSCSFKMYKRRCSNWRVRLFA